MRFIYFRPVFLTQRFIQTGQINFAARKFQNRFNQFFHRRKSRRRPGNNNTLPWFVTFPDFSLRRQQAVTPLAGINQLAFRQYLRPIMGNDFQKFERFLPMGGIILRHQLLQFAKRKLFVVHHINQRSQLLRQKTSLPQRHLLHAELRRLGHDNLNKQQQPLGRSDCRIHAVQKFPPAAAGQKQLVFLYFAQRHHAWQQHRR